MIFGHRAGCDHVALGWNGQPWRRMDETDGHGTQRSEISAATRAGRGYGVVGSHRQVHIFIILIRRLIYSHLSILFYVNFIFH